MNTKICLIRENSLVYSDSGYAILSAGTPVLLQGVIKDPESGEEVASIVDDKGNPYKMLEADLISLSEEELKTLLNDFILSDCEKKKKKATKMRPIPMGLIVAAVPFALLKSFGLSLSPFLSVLPIAFCFSAFLVAMKYVQIAKASIYPISEDYFLSYEENKEKIEVLLQKEKEKEEEKEEYADLGAYED